MDMLWVGTRSGEWTADQTKSVTRIVVYSTEILRKLVLKNLTNKQEVFRNMLLVLDWVCLDVGAE